jgi:hypothetical protein
VFRVKGFKDVLQAVCKSTVNIFPPLLSPEMAKVAELYSGGSNIIPPIVWSVLAPPNIYSAAISKTWTVLPRAETVPMLLAPGMLSRTCRQNRGTPFSDLSARS